jgi:hypothetical protein
MGFGDPGRTPYWSVWKEVLTIGVGNEAIGLPGLVPVLRVFRSLLDQVSALVAAQDLDGLKALSESGELDAIDQASADLGIILQTFSEPDRLVALGELMGTRSRPALVDPSNLIPEALWTGRDWLHWKQTGEFATELRARAEAAGDDAARAYALGWQVAYATLMCTSGFVNSAVGSCYRTHWWRHRWVSNFIDTWVWGFYGAGAAMAGDTPNPPFADWPGLCDAKLHTMVDVTGGADFEGMALAMAAENELPSLLPAAFTDVWLDAFGAAYGAVTPPLFTAEGLQRGYAALLAVLWFQTSGEVIGCNPDPGPPPDACGDRSEPNWTDPTAINPTTGQPFQPEQPTPEGDPDEAEIVSGVILALLGLGLLFFGGGAAGAAALAGGIALIVDGAMEVDWDDLECDVYWIEVYLHNGLTALHTLAVLGAAQHPYPRDLAVDQLVLKFGDNQLPYTSGAAVCKSQALRALHTPWSGLISTWTSPPSEPVELPYSDVWRLSDEWPSIVIDDAAGNPATASIRNSPGAWPGGIEGSFGPAVQGALSLVQDPPATLPNWNLDGDRARGMLTWELAAPYTNPVAPVPET